MSDTHGKLALPDSPTHPLVRAAMEHGSLDPATLRDLLALQREYEAGEARKLYRAAMVALKRDMPSVVGRDALVDYTGSKGRVTYRHASLAGILDAIVPHLGQHGFSHAWEPSTDQRGVTVTCRLSHEAGHSEQATITAPTDTSGGKSPAQGVASTITLLSRYTLSSLLGIASADMPEPGPAPDEPDPARARKACSKLAAFGLTVDDAVGFVGKPVGEWTSEDITRLGAWVKEGKEAK